LVETGDRKNTGGRMGDGKKDARTRRYPMKRGKVTKSKFKKSASTGRAYLERKRNTIRESLKATRSVRKQTTRLIVNGQLYELEVGDKPSEIKPSDTLAYTLRETLGLTGTKIGCDHGACGSCTILMDGKPVLSCLILTIETDGKSITTIEGLGNPNTGELDPLQQAFIDHTAFQCGFCTPGILMSTKALLNENSSPTEEEIKEALAGNYCRCISHYQVLDAVMAAVRKGGNRNV